ncbi:hypothetical protein V9L16_00190 [Pseudomonas tolaasii]|uniref:hypothetical protein n=1 Tax=Pseudomonas tolaasii TaxID=29442 RepID=UPI0030CBE788
MKIFIGFATRNSFLQTAFLKLRNSIPIPRDFHGVPLTIELGAPNLNQSKDLESYFFQKASANDALLVVADERCESSLEFTRTALFIRWVTIPSRVENPEAYMRHHTASLLTTFDAFCKEVVNGENRQASLLPERNFNADEWRELVETVRKRVQVLEFVEETKALFALLKERKKPRRNTTDATRFYIDDDDKHFIYGDEHHSLPATGTPHTPSCELNFRFRFGRKIADIQRHFNVNRGRGKNPSIKGCFHNCHGELKDVTRTSHLNMFMNDFY